MITLRQHIELSRSAKDDSMGRDYWMSLPPKEKIEFMRGIDSVYPLKDTKEITPYIKDNFKYYDNVFDMVLGQFIMVEQILTGKFDFRDEFDMDVELAAYLLRPKDEIEFDNEDPLKEQQVRKKIMDTPVQDFYSAINKFLLDRERVLFHQFSGVFYETPDEEEETDEEVDTSDYNETVFNQQWYWYSIVRTLAQEDITRFADIYMLKMNVVLPEMSYIAQKNKIDSANQRAAAAMNRL